MQALVDGDAARALAELGRTRWCRAKNAIVEPTPPAFDPWPDSVVPDFANVRIGISRTEPHRDEPRTDGQARHISDHLPVIGDIELV